ncbi:MAG TPA: VOC family protein [Candidatus Limnocylindrales bacterium]|nr:VOC family protein [Candidatus Limnocylindrales bacterium]
MKLLGIDNVLFSVGDLDATIEHYRRLGFELRFRLPDPPIALFGIGPERPGLLIRAGETPGGGQLWVEVPDATSAADELRAAGLAPAAPIRTATGLTVEVADPWGNVVGFADYALRPPLARPHVAERPAE